MDESSNLSRSVAAALGIAAGIALGWVALWTGAASAAFDPGSPEETSGPTEADCEAQLPELTERTDALDTEVAALKFEEGLLRSQLGIIGGLPIPWPDDLPAALRPERFAESASQAIAGVEGLEFVQEDCAEYPCLVVARVKDGLEPAAAQAALHQLGERLGDLLGGEDARTFLSVAKVSDDEGGEDTLAVAGVAPGGRDDISDGLTERMMQRVQGLEQELGPDAPPE